MGLEAFAAITNRRSISKRSGTCAGQEIALRRAIELKSRDEFRDFYLALGMVLAAKGDSQGALQAFEHEVRESPDLQEALDRIRQLRAR